MQKITDLYSAFSLFLLMIKKCDLKPDYSLYDLRLKNKRSEKKKNLSVSSQFNFLL